MVTGYKLLLSSSIYAIPGKSDPPTNAYNALFIPQHVSFSERTIQKLKTESLPVLIFTGESDLIFTRLA